MNSPTSLREFNYRGFAIAIELTGDDGEQPSGRADVYRDGRLACPVALTSSQSEREDLIEKLGCKAKELVDGLLAAGKPAAAGGIDDQH